MTLFNNIIELVCFALNIVAYCCRHFLKLQMEASRLWNFQSPVTRPQLLRKMKNYLQRWNFSPYFSDLTWLFLYLTLLGYFCSWLEPLTPVYW